MTQAPGHADPADREGRDSEACSNAIIGERAKPRVVFAGTPDFAATALRAIVQAGYPVVRVLTQPDRPAGRGMKLQASPVKQLAEQQGLPVLQPRSLRRDGRWPDDAQAAHEHLSADAPDVMVVAAYGLILPQWVLSLPRHGCLNIHASLLPRWRGAAPIQRAIEAGDERTGVTIMQMDAGLDTGAMLRVVSVDIGPLETAATLHDRLATAGADALLRTLEDLQHGRLKPVGQPTDGVTYAHKIAKDEAPVDWTRPAAEIERRLRAFDPFPGATMTLSGQTFKLWRGRCIVDPAGRPAGTLFRPGPGRLAVACGDGALECLELQVPGGRRQAVASLLQGPLSAVSSDRHSVLT